jgi:hypothetical protein
MRPTQEGSAEGRERAQQELRSGWRAEWFGRTFLWAISTLILEPMNSVLLNQLIAALAASAHI